MPSIMDIHKQIVNELRQMGEIEIFNPTNKSFLHNGYPDVYVKGRIFPSKDFISGTAFREKDGTITILNDHFIYYYKGFQLDQLGLCDPVIWYENFNLRKPQKQIDKCPCCGK